MQIIAKLDRYRLEALEDVDKEDRIKSTRSVEALRKSYHKEFLYQAQKTKACIECQAATKSIVFYRSRFIYEGYKADPDEDEGFSSKKSRKDGPKEKTELKPDELKKHFRKLWEKD